MGYWPGKFPIWFRKRIPGPFGNQPFTPGPYWQMDTSTRVHYAGMPSATFASSAVFAGAYTVIATKITDKNMQWGYIRQVKVNVVATGSGYLKFKVFRKNGSNYDMVSESEQITPSGTGAQTYNLSTPMACKPDDFLGIYISHVSTTVAYKTVSDPGHACTRYVAGDITTSNAFSSSSNTAQINIEGLGISPYFTVTGDSVAEGHPYYAGIYDGTASSALSSSPYEQLRGLTDASQNGGFEYQNFASDAKTFAWVLSTGAPAALAVGARVLYINAGLNDIDTGRTWADVLADLNAILVLFNASGFKRLLIGEITPASTLDDAEAATVRLWNTNLANWCVANGGTLIPIHDSLGQIRVSTGELDDLAAAYDSGDGVHPNAAGYGIIAATLNAYLG